MQTEIAGQSGLIRRSTAKALAAAAADRKPDPVDIHVGARVRTRRKLLGLSQEALAETIDLTFQQVQKYERGSNRISASKLYAIAKALKAPVSYFFDGITDDVPTDVADMTAEQAIGAFLVTTEGLQLAQAFPRIASAKERARLLALIDAMAGVD